MAASDHLQLKLFMTPDELVGGQSYVRGSVDLGPTQTVGDLMDRKEQYAKGANAYYTHHDGRGDYGDTLHDSIRQFGVAKPVILTHHDDLPSRLQRKTTPGRFVIGNGNHRTATAAAVQRETGRTQYVPVIHDDEYMGNARTQATFGIASF